MRTKARKQCEKCPWKVSTDPYEIPNGYCSIKHARLKGTISEPGQLRLGPVRIMACHESPVGFEFPCVGWLHNQLGVGNNIGLRMLAMTGHVDCAFELVGDQHERLEDTLPCD